MENQRVYTHAQLLEMEGQEIKFRTSLKEVKIDNVYLYNVASVKVRGLRGTFAFIDLFDSDEKNIATITVFNTDKLEVYDITYPGFKISKA